MFIQCPNCRFSGRIPDHALGSGQSARCPKCRFRFELRLVHYLPAVGAPFDSSFDGSGADDGTAIEGDAGSSSYELKAITDDFGAATGVVHASQSWGDRIDDDHPDRDEIVDSAPPRFSGIAARSEARKGSLLSERRLEAPPSSGLREPWYSRVLQVWGVVLLVWAFVIMARSLLPIVSAGNGPPREGEATSAVISVMLLVPGAAALFLIVDLGRFLRRRLQAADRQEESSTTTGPATLNLRIKRFWHRPFRTAPSVRP
jgi:predicted Zn finger-like uncharacterized protein